MNSLSLLLYAADALSSVASFLFFTGGIALFCAAMWAVVEEEVPPLKWILIPLSMIFVACLIPSKTTMYAIAASEVGESIINNPSVQQTGGKAFKALDAWLDKQVSDDSSPEKKEEGQ